jgi:hypothetical protein
MAKNLRTGLRQSIKASSKAGVTGGGIFSLAPLDLRFALLKTLDPRVTFTRASSGTYVGSDGVLRSAVTNLLIKSEEFDQWTASNITVTANNIAAPNGLLTADLFDDGTTAAVSHRVLTPVTVSFTSGVTYTFSLYVKNLDRTFVQLAFGSTAFGATAYANFNVSTGIVGTVGASATASITALSNEWYRCTLSYTATSTASDSAFIAAIPSATSARNESYTGSNKKLYVWGAQVEASPTVGEYVPTTSTINSAPRFDHNPTTGESLGLLVEEARTNLLLNSATLSTQSVTVAAAANTLSFYGTGTVTLTGVSTAGPLVGTGANNRVSLTFTPTVGVLVVTVSGSVTNAQLEAGAFATSYIPTTSATVTRAADVASVTGANFSSWYNQTEGTVFAEYSRLVNASGRVLTFNDTTANEQIRITASLSTNIRPDWQVIDGGVVQANVLSAAEVAVGATGKTAGVYKLNDFQQATNSTLGTADTVGTLPTLTVLNIGANETGSSSINGTIKRLTYWPVRLANPTLQSITTP